MIFRLKQYIITQGKTDLFNKFFQGHLLPIQKRHGARLVGRWQNGDGKRITALWSYDSVEHYKLIESRVKTDPDSIKAQEYRQQELAPLFQATSESFLQSTVPLELTELSHLKESSTNISL